RRVLRRSRDGASRARGCRPPQRARQAGRRARHGRAVGGRWFHPLDGSLLLRNRRKGGPSRGHAPRHGLAAHQPRGRARARRRSQPLVPRPRRQRPLGPRRSQRRLARNILSGRALSRQTRRSAMSLEDALFAIEERLWLSGKDRVAAHLDAQCLLALPQAGEMHGIFPREHVAAPATPGTRWRDLSMTDRHLLEPAGDVALISYRADVTRADGEPYAALVSSAYVRRGHGWKLAFHQHSPI